MARASAYFSASSSRVASSSRAEGSFEGLGSGAGWAACATLAGSTPTSVASCEKRVM